MTNDLTEGAIYMRLPRHGFRRRARRAPQPSRVLCVNEAVVTLTRSLARDHVGDQVRVDCICPGTIDSPWVRPPLDEGRNTLEALAARRPLGPFGARQEIAAALTWPATRQRP
jgi:NAD(P)-dependent dehydrogenase (short-subunit alcohol dehydrogenase family)